MIVQGSKLKHLFISSVAFALASASTDTSSLVRFDVGFATNPTGKTKKTILTTMVQSRMVFFYMGRKSAPRNSHSKVIFCIISAKVIFKIHTAKFLFAFLINTLFPETNHVSSTFVDFIYKSDTVKTNPYHAVVVTSNTMHQLHQTFIVPQSSFWCFLYKFYIWGYQF